MTCHPLRCGRPPAGIQSSTVTNTGPGGDDAMTEPLCPECGGPMIRKVASTARSSAASDSQPAAALPAFPSRYHRRL
jgi:hypothetical protein